VQQYKQRGETLESIDVDIDAPRWGEPGEHTVQQRIDSWKPLLDSGGVLLGAFDGHRLVGFAIYQPASASDPANLAVLHVTKTHRHHGVGCELTDEVARLARADGAQRLYVSATPTRATVDFYIARGFKPLATPDTRLYALEPDDIHMERAL
jgi:predicted N-acetyltransferase YhbS